jgi:hypothetical protein
VNASVYHQLPRCKRRPLRRLENGPGVESPEPMTTASNIGYEPSGGTPAIAPGGIWAVHLLTRKVGLVQNIDRVLHLLKRHPPYYGSIGADARSEWVVLLAGFPSVSIQASPDGVGGVEGRAEVHRGRIPGRC